jgi:hypothetical protein
VVAVISGCSSPETRNVVTFRGGTSAGTAWAGAFRKGKNEMHPEDLMKPDLFSEIVLTGSGGLLLASLLLIIAIALTRV